jgi:hypothetical protein
MPNDARSFLTSFEVTGGAPRVYYLDVNSHVNELAWENGWVPPTDLTALTHAAPAAAGSPLTCFGVNGVASRVYYLDANSHVNELAWENGWVNTDLTALVAMLVSGPRQTVEGGWLGAGVDMNITVQITAPPGYQWDGQQPIIALLDTRTNSSSLPGPGEASVNSATLDASGNLVVSVHCGWTTGDPVEVTVSAKFAIPAAAGSPLTCFGVNGVASRVYYLDANSHVNELAWENGWVNNLLP